MVDQGGYVQSCRQMAIALGASHPITIQLGTIHGRLLGMKPYPIGSMYAIYGNIYHQYTPNVSIYTIHLHGSYGYFFSS